MKIRLVGTELLHAGGQTDGQTEMMKLIVTFSQYCRLLGSEQQFLGLSSHRTD